MIKKLCKNCLHWKRVDCTGIVEIINFPLYGYCDNQKVFAGNKKYAVNEDFGCIFFENKETK